MSPGSIYQALGGVSQDVHIMLHHQRPPHISVVSTVMTRSCPMPVVVIMSVLLWGPGSWNSFSGLLPNSRQRER